MNKQDDRTGGDNGLEAHTLRPDAFNKTKHDGGILPDTDTDADTVNAIMATLLGQSTPLSDEDFAAFDAELDAADIAPEKRRELLQMLWNIVVAFVDLEWKQHPVQQAQKACGQIPESGASPAFAGDPVVNSKHKKTNEIFEQAADASAAER
ncbi:MAG: hypothetical protein ACFB2Z_11105 [Maricaulaceae bacterium]